MDMSFQRILIEKLKDFSKDDVHSLLIEGHSGCGKTYLSKYYSNLLGVDDFIVMKPSVDNVRSILKMCYESPNKIAICIENLDGTTLKSSYTLLKFLEEPTSNAYIIVTCSNIYDIPSTIISRSITLSVPNIKNEDIDEYAKNLNVDKYRRFKSSRLWKCVKSLSDINVLFNMKLDEVDYFNTEISQMVSNNFKDNVSNCVWKLSHYRDNSETPIYFVLRYIMINMKDGHKVRLINECSNSLKRTRLSKHAILSKFVFEYKYGV